jgi:hypothetical protein
MSWLDSRHGQKYFCSPPTFNCTQTLPRILLFHSHAKILASALGIPYRDNKFAPTVAFATFNGKVPVSNTGWSNRTFPVAIVVSFPRHFPGHSRKASQGYFLLHPFQLIIHCPPIIDAIWPVILSALLSEVHIQIQGVFFVADRTTAAVMQFRGRRRFSMRQSCRASVRDERYSLYKIVILLCTAVMCCYLTNC